VVTLYGLLGMTNNEWLNVRPQDSFANENYRVKQEYINYNIVIEYPERVVSKEEFQDFLKRKLF